MPGLQTGFTEQFNSVSPSPQTHRPFAAVLPGPAGAGHTGRAGQQQQFLPQRTSAWLAIRDRRAAVCFQPCLQRAGRHGRRGGAGAARCGRGTGVKPPGGGRWSGRGEGLSPLRTRGAGPGPRSPPQPGLAGARCQAPGVRAPRRCPARPALTSAPRPLPPRAPGLAPLRRESARARARPRPLSPASHHGPRQPGQLAALPPGTHGQEAPGSPQAPRCRPARRRRHGPHCGCRRPPALWARPGPAPRPRSRGAVGGAGRHVRGRVRSEHRLGAGDPPPTTEGGGTHPNLRAPDVARGPLRGEAGAGDSPPSPPRHVLARAKAHGGFFQGVEDTPM